MINDNEPLWGKKDKIVQDVKIRSKYNTAIAYINNIGE